MKAPTPADAREQVTVYLTHKVRVSIDKLRAERGLSRSEWLEDAAREKSARVRAAVELVKAAET